MAKTQKSNKMRKVGRNALFCKSYLNTNRREKNKLVKLNKHLARFPDDANALKAVDAAKAAIRGY